MRNACVRHAAVRLGLPVPAGADLDGVPDGASLAEAVDWWRAAQGNGTDAAVAAPRSAWSTAGLVVLKGMWAAGIVVVGLALSYGRVH